MAWSSFVVLLAVAVAVVFHGAAPALALTVKVWSSCSPGNYTAGAAYDTNLRGMLTNLVTLAASYGGYGNDTAGAGAGTGEHPCYGLAICYADAPPEVCRLCVGMAAGNVSLACPRAVAAAMMYNNCLLRYSNASFLARPDMEPRFSFYNNLTLAGDADHYAGALGRLMDRLAPAAAAEAAALGRLFAYGRANLTGGQSLYGFAQCVPDLSPEDCRRCLRRVAASLPIWTKGGRAYSLTCYTRFEVVPFYMPPNTKMLDVAAPAPETAPESPAAAKSRGAKRTKFPTKKTVTAAALTVAALILVMVCVILGINIRKSGKFQSIRGKDSVADENIEALLESYGSLAPRRYKYSQLKEITRVLVKNLEKVGTEWYIKVLYLLARSKRALVYEYMPNGSLDKFIYADNSKTTLGWDKLYEIAIGIARGLEYLHRGCNTRIIHFDIKPHNILLADDFIPKIADFGLAKLCNPKESYLSMAGMRGTIGFIAPEVFARRFGVVSTKSDVYSYGMMLLEMVGGRKNLKSSVENLDEVYFPDWIYSQLAEAGSLHSLDIAGEAEEIARKMTSIGLWCIQVSPMSRPTMSKVLEMFEKIADELEIPPKQYFYAAMQEHACDEEPPPTP
ncbi:hypothetical protein ACP4OV_030392 [Aristida adscensionis]